MAIINQQISDKTEASNYEVFSLEEAVIGMWMDKPFYRKVVPFTTASSGTTTVIEAADATRNYINIYGYIGTSPIRYFFNSYSATADVKLRVYNNAVQVFLGGENTMYGQQGYAVLEYTKTTD